MQTIARDMERSVDPFDAKTRELPRPRLTHRPLPRGWVIANEGGMLVHSSGFQVENPVTAGLDEGELAALEDVSRGIADLAAWARHERAVRAQFEGHHLAILDDIALYGPGPHWSGSLAAKELEHAGMLRKDGGDHHLTPAGLAVVQGGLR